ncbi:hypothetical protein D3C79_659340 [compost metagenome]
MFCQVAPACLAQQPVTGGTLPGDQRLGPGMPDQQQHPWRLLLRPGLPDLGLQGIELLVVA